MVYDRIRENMQRMRDVTLYRLINISTSQTLSRTILTGVTTILSIVAFFFWGTPVIRDFAFAFNQSRDAADTALREPVVARPRRQALVDQFRARPARYPSKPTGPERVKAPAGGQVCGK